jgi:hypothetical protein
VRASLHKSGRSMPSGAAAQCEAINYVSADQSRAVVFVFQLKDGQPLPVRPQGLDPNKAYIKRAGPGMAPATTPCSVWASPARSTGSIIPSGATTSHQQL